MGGLLLGFPLENLRGFHKVIGELLEFLGRPEHLRTKTLRLGQDTIDVALLGLRCLHKINPCEALPERWQLPGLLLRLRALTEQLW